MINIKVYSNMSLNNKKLKANLTITTEFSNLNTYPVILIFSNNNFSISLNLAEIKNKDSKEIVNNAFKKILYPLKNDSKSTFIISYSYIYSVDYGTKQQNMSSINEVFKKIKKTHLIYKVDRIYK